MPADIGTLLVRISADISELKKGAAQAAAEIKKLQNQVNEGTSSINSWGAAFGGVGSSLNSALGGMGSFLGLAFSIYGVLRLWQSAVEGFYNLMSHAVSQIDDYQRAMIGTAGMMTTITDRKYQPDLGAAYESWKVYLAWLYDASLETDRKVAAGGKEIFEAARLMGIRGAVAKTKDDVYTVGLLVDFIKSITQGMPERQQLLQEVRSMFEGSMRPGAQALAQFEAIMPGFRDKFEQARKSAMAMGDASPIFALLREALKGASFAATDMQNTFESLYSSATGAFQKLMLEAFTPAYDQLVKWGWELMNVFYQQGKLTDQGQNVAKALTAAWDAVKVKIQEWVDVITSNPERVTNIIQRVCDFLGNAANLALTLARALEVVVNTIGSVTTGNIEALGAALLVASAAALALGANIKAAVVAAAAGFWVGEWLQTIGDKTQQKSIRGQHAALSLSAAEKEEASKVGKERTTWGFSSAENEWDAAIEIRNRKLENTTKTYLGTIQKSKFETVKAFQDWQAAEIKAVKGNEDLSAGEKLLRISSLSKASYDAGQVTPENAPDVPRVKMSGGKADKKGAAGKTDEYAQLFKQLADIEARIEQASLDKKIAAARAEFKRMGQEIEEQWKRGELSYSQYFDKLKANLTSTYEFEKSLINAKIEAANKNLAIQLENNKQRAANKELSVESSKILDDIEKAKTKLTITKAQGDLEKLGIKNAEDLIKLKEKELALSKSIFEYTQQTRWQEMAAKGPVSTKEAAVEQMWDKFYKSMEDKGIKKGDTEQVKVTKRDEKGQFTEYVPGGQLYEQELLKAKSREWEIKWGEVTKSAANAVSSGFEDLIEGVMSGSGDFKKTANTMFKSLFKAAMKPGLDALTEQLIGGFKSMFKSLGEGAGLAILGAIAMIGMMLTSSKKSSSFTPSGVTSQVTGHESVRGIIAGETSTPTAEISVSLQEALVQTNSILDKIESNTRGLGQVQMNLTIDIPGIKDAVATAIENYFAEFAQTLGRR